MVNKNVNKLNSIVHLRNTIPMQVWNGDEFLWITKNLLMLHRKV